MKLFILTFPLLALISSRSKAPECKISLIILDCKGKTDKIEVQGTLLKIICNGEESTYPIVNIEKIEKQRTLLLFKKKYVKIIFYSYVNELDELALSNTYSKENILKFLDQYDRDDFVEYLSNEIKTFFDLLSNSSDIHKISSLFKKYHVRGFPNINNLLLRINPDQVKISQYKTNILNLLKEINEIKEFNICAEATKYEEIGLLAIKCEIYLRLVDNKVKLIIYGNEDASVSLGIHQIDMTVVSTEDSQAYVIIEIPQDFQEYKIYFDTEERCKSFVEFINAIRAALVKESVFKIKEIYNTTMKRNVNN
jgi:hypothetical protein